MRHRLLTVAGWALVVAALVLAGRALAYALAPDAGLQGDRLAGDLGGPPLAALAVLGPLVALAAGATVLWLAVLGVSERCALAAAPRAARPPPPRVRVVARRAVALWVVSCLAFAAVESYVHWRAGLGFHGLHCLLGPVHRDVVPLLAALSVLASCWVAAGAHVLAWWRRSARGLLGAPPRAAPPDVLLLGGAGLLLPRSPLLASRGPRGPPARTD